MRTLARPVRDPRALEASEPMLQQLVRAVEIGPQPPHRGGAVLARERLLARRAEDLPVHADEEPCRDARIALLETGLALNSIGHDTDEARHHLELLRLQRGRLFDDARERGKAGAAEPRAFSGLQAPQRTENRFA